MANGKKLKFRREKLWNQNPKCFFCDRLTVLPEGTKPREDWATIEHLRSRLNPTRQEPKSHPYEERTVLCCWKCNNDRNKAEEAAMPIEELRKRSGVGTKFQHPRVEELKKAFIETGTEFEKLEQKGMARKAMAYFIRGQIEYGELLMKIEAAKSPGLPRKKRNIEKMNYEELPKDVRRVIRSLILSCARAEAVVRKIPDQVKMNDTSKEELPLADDLSCSLGLCGLIMPEGMTLEKFIEDKSK